MNRNHILLVGALVAGCNLTPSSLTPAGTNVHYAIHPNEVAGCTSLGEVTISDPIATSSAMGQGLKSEERDQAVTELRNAAGEKGANFVFVDEEKLPSLERGTAYRCGS